ncbi:MAG: TIGR04348 family glycosyltransferase [Pseudomonadota bacterium]|nr:TIGR04348 family glycosyltransferase [Pseudomonadota bacterium]
MSSTSSSPGLPRILIVSPTLAAANTGNWHTASRWAQMLRKHCRIGIADRWQGEPCDLLIALHARRSSPSIAAFAQAQPQRPLIVVLTGTDLYRDIRNNAAAQRSLELASRLVVLQDQGPLELAPALRSKCSVIYQSAPPLAPVAAPRSVLRVVSVGHLRDEKDPLTFMRAAERLRLRTDIRFDQIGGTLDPVLEAAATRTAAICPNYRRIGNVSQPAARQRIRRAQLLVNTSRLEGGAQVILEAAQSGTAVLASHIPGNVGMLGPRHAGLFEVGDDAQLARLIERARDDVVFLGTLREATVARAPLFAPAEEERRLVTLLHSTLQATPP